MIEVISKDKNSGRITFLLKGANPGFANALRRIMQEEVPSMAIEDVEFKENSSALFDEMVAHRLGLLPLTSDLKGYDIKNPEDELSAKNSVKLTLKAKGPCTVYAEDLKSKDPKIKPVFPKTPIVKLLKGQELELEATAVLGRGKQHMKFAPCLAWYSFKSKVTVNNSAKDFAAFKDKFPSQVFKDNKIDAKLIEEHNLYDAVDGVNEDIVKVEKDDSSFVFTVEPFGQLSVQEIVAAAADRLNELLEDFSGKLTNAEVAEPGQMR
jgi:DNA-directed RNA polymerase subunit D